MRVRQMAVMATTGILALVAPVSAQFVTDASDPTLVPSGPAPSLVFVESGVDFGVIADITPVEHRFTFRNDGVAPLIIDRVTGSCGCTVPELEKKTYAPGESGVVLVKYDPKGRHGPQNQTVTVVSNDPKNPQLRLAVKVNVEPIVTIEPTNLGFGIVPKDAGSEMVVKVTGSDPDFTVTKAWVERWDIPGSAAAVEGPGNAKFFEAVLGEVELGQDTHHPGKTVRQVPIRIRFKPGAPLGMIRDVKLHFETSDSRSPKHEVPLLVTHQGDVITNPPRVVLGRLEPSQSFTQTFTLASASGKAFKITGVEHQGMPADLDIAHTIAPNDPENPTAYTVTLTGHAPAQSSTIRGTYVFSTDVEREQAITVAYYGGVVVQPPTQAPGSQVNVETMRPVQPGAQPTTRPSGGHER